MYKLSPSDFAYLYEECKLCYYLKVKHKIYQPSMPMPGVFSAINTRLQTPLVGKELGTVADGLPEGRVVKQEGWVESVPVKGTNVFIKGKYDLLVDSGDGEFILVDLKISQPHVGKIDKYKTQLNAYKYALENPASGKAIAVTRLGLLVFYPDEVKFEEKTAKFTFPPKWLEVPVDGEGFERFAREIDGLLSGPRPAESKECKWCQYRHKGDELSHRAETVQEYLPF